MSQNRLDRRVFLEQPAPGQQVIQYATEAVDIAPRVRTARVGSLWWSTHKGDVFDGEHEPIVNANTFRRVQTLLQRNGRTGGRALRNKYGALLRGLLHCAACNCGMSHAFSAKGSRRYRYYVCNHAQKNGWDECPSPFVPAGEIERFVIDQIKCVGRDPKSFHN